MTLARVRRRMLQAGAILMFVVLAGATYQGVATALERRAFRHPGRLVDVGGHQLHLYCTGEGAPTVILEAPAGGMSAAWGWVQPEVSETTRVCSYDRAGLGWSEAGDDGFDPASAPEQLAALLDRADQRARYVIVGHGLGAALARLEAGRFGGDTAALVLIDPPDAGGATRRERPTWLVTWSPWLARTGVLRATRMLSDRAAGLPDPWAGALRTFLNRPDHLTRASQELAQWDRAIALASDAALPPYVAVAEVRTGRPAPLSFLDDERDAATVTDAILAAVAAVRNQHY